MPPVAMETILGFLDYPDITQHGEDIHPCIGCWGTTKPLGRVIA